MTKKDEKFLGVLKKLTWRVEGREHLNFCVFVCYKIKDYSEKVSESDLALTAVKHECSV